MEGSAFVEAGSWKKCWFTMNGENTGNKHSLNRSFSEWEKERNMTEKIYQKERYLKEMEALVLRVEGADVVLDRTIFAPDSGGQPCDLGRLGGFSLKNVTEKGEEIVHTLRSEADAAKLKAGDRVQLVLDWPRRFDHMQNHLGEHILSGLFKSVYNLDNKGFHLGDTDGTFDLDTLELTEEMIREVENRANQAVYDAVPVQVDLLRSAEDALKYPLRKELKVEEDIIVVSVPGVDCVACCCPHLSDTSQIGIIKITGTEKYKQLTRVHFKCGWRALQDYQQKHVDVAALSERYSADEFTLLDKIEKVEQKNNRIRREYNDFKTAMALAKARELADGSTKVACSGIEGADMDYLRTIAKQLSELTDLPAVLYSETALCVLLTAVEGSPVQCGKLVKTFAEGGRGGGSPTQAQAVFQDAEAMKQFVEKAVEAIRTS